MVAESRVDPGASLYPIYPDIATYQTYQLPLTARNLIYPSGGMNFDHRLTVLSLEACILSHLANGTTIPLHALNQTFIIILDPAQ